MIPQGRRDLWFIPVVLAVLAWDGVGRRWRALVAHLRPATLTAAEQHLLRSGARRARAEEWRG